MSRIIELERWRTPASEYPRSTNGSARVRTRFYPPGAYDCYMQRGYLYFLAERRLYITCLEIGGKTWMVDDPPHWWAMEDHARHYSGHVLCAGLGLGLIVHTLTANPEVERITVVERERDVIDLIGPRVPHDKLTIIEGDFHRMTPADFDGVDGVLYDLFVGDGLDLLGAAGSVMASLAVMWGILRPDPEFPIRIHGFSQDLVWAIAQAILVRGAV